MLYVLRSARAPWGDYGSILWHGLAEDGEDGGPLSVLRSGPFVPPISFPWPAVVLTDGLASQFSDQRFTGCLVRPAVVKKAVLIDWSTWDPRAEDPAQYPAEGEPENYILRRKHRADLVSKLPALHEIFVRETPGLQRDGGAIDLARYDGSDIVRGSRFGYIYVSPRLADWLRVAVPEWIALEPAVQS